MLYLQSLLNRILFLLLFTFCLFFLSYGQKAKLKSISWIDNWKIDVRAGSGALLSEVPDKYLNRINNVNIPLNAPGVTGILAVRKTLSPHFEMGYQFDYMRIIGNVVKENSTYNVLTQANENCFLLLYNLKSTQEYRPRFNYFGYYKVGGISLKNDPREIMRDGIPITGTGSMDGNKFIPNVAIITGIGFGINFQFTNNLSLVSTLEINRSSDAVAEIFYIHKVFYHSTHTVNNYSSLAVGLCYSFSFSKQKKSTYFSSKTETEKKLQESKISGKKGKSSTANLPSWYNPKHRK